MIVPSDSETYRQTWEGTCVDNGSNLRARDAKGSSLCPVCGGLSHEQSRLFPRKDSYLESVAISSISQHARGRSRRRVAAISIPTDATT